MCLIVAKCYSHSRSQCYGRKKRIPNIEQGISNYEVFIPFASPFEYL
jgi:hypothetical protein